MLGPTIHDFPNFDASSDAEALRNAMKGFGTNEDAVIKILTKRSNRQRQAIAASYKQKFNKDLVKDLKSELGGKLEKIILALMSHPAEYDAQKLHESMKGFGTDEDTLIEIVCSRTSSQLNYVKDAYKRLYNRNLEDDIKGDTSGSFEKLLVYLCKSNIKDSSAYMDKRKARADAEALLKAGIKNHLGTDDNVFCTILATQDHSHLRAVFDEYQHIAGHDIEDAIKREMSGDNEDAFLSLIECIRYPASFFAKKIHKAMEGFGTNDDDLVRLVVSRSEIDLAQIRQEFQRMYGRSLEAFIKADCSGDYENALVSLVVGNHAH